MDLDRSAGDSGDPTVYLHRRRNRAAFVELAAAAGLRMAANHLLAGARTAASLPDSVRRPRCSWFSSFPYAFEDAAAHGRTVGTDDARRTRKSPPTLGTLRIRTARCQPDSVSLGGPGLLGGNEMTISTISESQRTAAKIAGLASPISFVTVVVVNFGIIARLIVSRNPAETARNILAHE